MLAFVYIFQKYAETAMNELLGWYGYENDKEELNLSKKCKSHSVSNGSELGSPKSSGNNIFITLTTVNN